MAIACKLCIAEKGLKDTDIDNLPQTQEEFFDHLESVHHILVTRSWETDEQALKRFLEKYPEARICPDCIRVGAPWAKVPSHN